METFLVVFVTIVLCAVCFCVWLWGMSILGSWRAPYIPVPQSALNGIIQAIALPPHSVVYDIGSGDGRILRALSRANPSAIFVGIERALFPYLLARAWQMCEKNNRIHYVLADATTYQQFHKATHCICYLLPEFVKQVGKIVESQAINPITYISIDFPIKEWEHKKTQEIIITHKKSRGSLLFFYEIIPSSKK